MFTPKRKYVYGILALIVIAVLLILVRWSELKRDDIQKSSASSASKTITTKADWDAGTLANIDSASASGSISIQDKGTSSIDLLGGVLTASIDEADTEKAVDGNDLTYWGYNTCDTTHQWWKVDLGMAKNIAKIRFLTQGDAPGTYKVYSSTDDSDYQLIYETGGMSTYYGDIIGGGTVSARYVKIDTYNSQADACPFYSFVTVNVLEMGLFSTGYAIHTSAATQIDGSEGGTKNFIAWQTFTPTYTTPANTTVSYKFRTSPDSTTWTSWSAAQTPASGGAFDISSIVDSASGANKYLQVETTLSNTDGTSTPTVDSYSVGYHTNIKPSKPTAATAVIGE